MDLNLELEGKGAKNSKFPNSSLFIELGGMFSFEVNLEGLMKMQPFR